MKTKLIIGAIILILVALLGWHFIFPSGSNNSVMGKAPVAIDPSTLPGIQTGDAPWVVELSRLRERLSAIGLAALAEEGLTLHMHQHLDININGNPIAIPAGIGINEAAGFISPIHVHDATGVIHIESPVVRDFTLGEFFDVWGVRFTKDCIGGYCTGGANSLRVFVNGTKLTTDPRDLVLEAHQEIAIVYGLASTTISNIPSSFDFPAGE